MDKTEKKSSKRLYFLLIILIVILYGALAYWQKFWPFSLLQEQSVVNLGSQFVRINRDIFPDVKQLNQCNDWPIVGVELSPDRGNPFKRKTADVNAIVNTSTAQCRELGE
ncbi:MAG: hypothetical protein WC668_01350 [Patescibacteria group bacterium]|jgi:hypothetical protein